MQINTRHTNDTDDLRFTKIQSPTSLFPDTSKGPSGVGIYELDLGVIISKWYDFESKMLVDFAQDRLDGADQGEIYKMPTIELDWPGQTFSFGYMLETGRIISDEFDEFYFSRRSFFKGDTCSPKTPRSTGSAGSPGVVTYGTSLGKGIDFNAGFSKVIGADFPFDTIMTRNNNPVASNDYSFNLRFAMNEKALSFIKYASLYARQNHAGLFPPSGGLLAIMELRCRALNS